PVAGSVRCLDSPVFQINDSALKEAEPQAAAGSIRNEHRRNAAIAAKLRPWNLLDDGVVDDVEQAAILVAYPNTAETITGNGVAPAGGHALHAAKLAVFETRDAVVGRDPDATAIVLDQ